MVVKFVFEIVNKCMSNKPDFRTDLEQWSDMWDQMNASGVHPRPEQLQPQSNSFTANADSSKTQDTYYDYLDSEEQFQDDGDQYSQDDFDPNQYADEGLLQESDNKKSQNPVYPDSAGPDNEGPKPAWVNEDLLKEVEALKNRLFKVENSMARMGQGKKWTEKPIREDSRLMGEIKSLRQRIEKVSSQLGIQDEPSPWQVKKD